MNLVVRRTSTPSINTSTTTISAIGCVYLSTSRLKIGESLKKDLRLSRVGSRGPLNTCIFLLMRIISQRLVGEGEGGASTLEEHSTMKS